MQFLEYPYVIITVLAICFLIAGAIGLYFTIKSLKTANGNVEKSYCGISKIENDFKKTVRFGKNCCVIYISVSLDGIKRLYPESRVERIHEQIKSILLKYFCINIDGKISIYENNNFVAINNATSNDMSSLIDKCFAEINDILVKNNAVNIIKINFGYHCTSSVEVSFELALERAKKACSMADAENILSVYWDSSNGKIFERKIKIENSIQGEIDNNRFFLEYQPIIDAKTDEIIGAEVLSRLNSLDDGILAPKTFLSAVNNVGINDKFDYYIFEKNCKWISNDKERRSKYVFTINFSRLTLCEENFADNIIKIIEKFGCDYSSIALEILEDKSLTKEETSILIQNLKRLKEKGILILLDDFGSGYTTFGDMAEFDIDIVKIDKEITQNATNDTGFLILKNIIKTAHDLGVKTLCEGIETEEHKKLVVQAGCDILQGFLFYRPMSVVKLETLFKD